MPLRMAKRYCKQQPQGRDGCPQPPEPPTLKVASGALGTARPTLRLAKRGIKRMLVICPAFVSDCLETLEEIGMRARETFIEAGGESLELVPCMNEHSLWLDALENMTHDFLSLSRTSQNQGDTTQDND